MKETISFSLETEDIQFLDSVAKKLNRTRSDALRQIIREAKAQ